MFDESIDAYLKAIERNPFNEKIYYDLGLVYNQKGLKDDAVKAFEMALEINPNEDIFNNL